MPATPGYTLTGSFEQLIGSTSGSVVLTLTGYAAQPPRISGTGMLAATEYQTTTGTSFSIAVWGNDQLLPANLVKKEHGGKDPYSMIVFTNHPHQYAAKDEKDPKKHLYSIASDDTHVPNFEALSSLHQAVTLYGNIPNKFPESEAVQA